MQTKMNYVYIAAAQADMKILAREVNPSMNGQIKSEPPLKASDDNEEAKKARERLNMPSPTTNQKRGSTPLVS